MTPSPSDPDDGEPLGGFVAAALLEVAAGLALFILWKLTR